MITQLIFLLTNGTKLLEKGCKNVVIRDIFENNYQQGEYQETLDRLGQINISPEENSIQMILAYLLKMGSYYELGEDKAARHCAELILSKSESFYNSKYNKVLNEAKKQIYDIYNM